MRLNRVMSELTLQPIRRIFFRAGAKRVSDKAADALINKMEDKAEKIVDHAQKLAKHAGRSTVMKKDIRMAAKMVKI
jgi:histone H3/H4